LDFRNDSFDLAARLGTFGNLARDSSLDALKKVLETLLLKSMQLNQQDQMIETKVLENRAAFERLLKVSMRGPAVSKFVATVVKAVMYDALQRAVDDFRQHCRLPHLYKDEEFSVAGKGLFWLLNSLVDFGIAELAARTILLTDPSLKCCLVSGLLLAQSMHTQVTTLSKTPAMCLCAIWK
jgi:hypothetical protein